MPKSVHIRDVPDELHRQLTARAAAAGMSLSAFLLQEISRVAERSSLDDLRARLATRVPARPAIPPAQALREERDSR